MKTAVVIPSMRGPKCLESFLEIASQDVDFIIISEKKLEKKYERTVEFNDKEVFEKSWIFNRHTKRNFGFAYALQQNYDVIVNLDDDCFPKSDTTLIVSQRLYRRSFFFEMMQLQKRLVKFCVVSFVWRAFNAT